MPSCYCKQKLTMLSPFLNCSDWFWLFWLDDFKTLYKCAAHVRATAKDTRHECNGHAHRSTLLHRKTMEKRCTGMKKRCSVLMVYKVCNYFLGTSKLKYIQTSHDCNKIPYLYAEWFELCHSLQQSQIKAKQKKYSRICKNRIKMY